MPKAEPAAATPAEVSCLSLYWRVIRDVRILPGVLTNLVDQYAAPTRDEAINGAVQSRAAATHVSGDRYTMLSTADYELVFTKANHRSAVGRHAPRPTFEVSISQPLLARIGQPVSSTLAMSPDKFSQALIRGYWLLAPLPETPLRMTAKKPPVPPPKKSTPKRKIGHPMLIPPADQERILAWLGVTRVDTGERLLKQAHGV